MQLEKKANRLTGKSLYLTEAFTLLSCLQLHSVQDRISASKLHFTLEKNLREKLKYVVFSSNALNFILGPLCVYSLIGFA